MNTQQNPMARVSRRERGQTPTHLERQMQQVQNEIDFVEILCNFWPLPNMTARRDRLERQLAELFQVHRQLQEERSPAQAPVRPEANTTSIFSAAAFTQKMYSQQTFGTRFPIPTQQAAH